MPGKIFQSLRFLDSDYFAQGASTVAALPPVSRVSRWFPFVFLHAFSLLAFTFKPSATAIAVAAILYFSRMFFITAFFHRYFAHRSFRTSRFMQFVFAFAGGMAVQRGALWWAAHHRHHHRSSDQLPDIHSPRQDGFVWSHIGWITADCNMPTRYDSIPDLKRYPELVFLNRFDWIPASVLFLSLYLVGEFCRHFLPALATSGYELVVWGFFVSTVVLFHCVCSINSLSHIFGKQRYQTGDDSKNNFFLALITLGEGWHNNHHRYQSSVRQGFYWWEIDVTYYVLRVLESAGVIWRLSPVPADAYLQTTSEGDDIQTSQPCENPSEVSRV